MLGIPGVAGIREQQKGVLDVRAMTTAMARRGPDGEGLTIFGDTVLGHRRLAIFDLSEAGRQPMIFWIAGLEWYSTVQFIIIANCARNWLLLDTPS